MRYTSQKTLNKKIFAFFVAGQHLRDCYCIRNFHFD